MNAFKIIIALLNIPIFLSLATLIRYVGNIIAVFSTTLGLLIVPTLLFVIIAGIIHAITFYKSSENNKSWIYKIFYVFPVLNLLMLIVLFVMIFVGYY